MSNCQDYRRVNCLMWSLQKRPLSFDVWRPASKGGSGLATWLPGGLAGPSPSALSKPGYPIGFAAKMEDDPDWPIESRTWWPILGKPKKSVGFLHVVTWYFRNVSDVISSQTGPDAVAKWLDLRGIWTELCIQNDPKERPPMMVKILTSHGENHFDQFFNEATNFWQPIFTRGETKTTARSWSISSISPRNATGE